VARNQYPPDEFDELPEGSPKGVHRRLPRPWTRFATFLVVVASFIGLAWGAARIYSMADDVSWLHWLRDLFTDEQPNVTPSWTPIPTPTPSPSPSYDLDLGATIIVFNGGAPDGFAGEVEVYILEGTDFTDVSAENWGGDSYSENAVVFQSDDFEDSAMYIADLLGIASVSLGSTSDADIAVIVVSEVELDPLPSPSSSPSPSPTSSP